MEITEQEEAGRYEYKGVTYHFCSISCLNKFKADPEKFLKRPDFSEKMEKEEKNLGKTETVTLPVHGMTCASCVLTIEKAVSNLPGVVDIGINFASEKAVIAYDKSIASLDDIKKRIKDVGYEVGEENETLEDRSNIEWQNSRKRLMTVWFITGPIIILMLLDMAFKVMIPGINFIMTVLGALAVFMPGHNTLKAGYNSIRNGAASMDVLIGIGTLAALITGVLKIFNLPIENYAGIAGMIMAFHLTGRYIEAMSKGKASQAIQRLIQLGVKTVRIISGQEEKEIPIEQLKVGDVMIIKPGEKIPTDGEVVSGTSTINESMVTGEPIPVKKKAGNTVIGATINQQGLLQVKATKVGKDTFLAQIIKLVEQCQSSKFPIQEFADRITAKFVPIILIISGSTFVIWLLFADYLTKVLFWAYTFLPWINPYLSPVSLAIFAAVAVLVIACPCALGLATPTALMVGSGIGAEKGILFRSGSAIQTLKDVKAIVFDKTGTLTKGRPEVTDIEVYNNVTNNVLLEYATSLESGSEHPLASAIIESAKSQGIKISAPSNFQAISGKGIIGKVNGKQVIVGSKMILQEYHIDYSLAKAQIVHLENEAKTIIIVAIDNSLAGVIAIADALKSDSQYAISELKLMDINLIMLTGDNLTTAKAIGKKVGINRVEANVLPADKQKVLEKLQKEFGVVAMVGDGINDAPALTQADVGIAIGTGTDIAIESSDVTLVRGDLSSVVTAIKLSKATFRKIKQNLFWAIFYNAIAIPLAVLGLLHPLIAEIAMAASSLNVVTNSIRLKNSKI